MTESKNKAYLSVPLWTYGSIEGYLQANYEVIRERGNVNGFSTQVLAFLEQVLGRDFNSVLAVGLIIVF